jgi:quinol monooxygenase YgiN
LDASDETRLSVVIVNVHPGREDEFLQLAVRLKETLERQAYCAQAQTIRDEGVTTCFYLVWHWVNADAATRSHADREVSELRTELHRVGLVTHAINGARALTATETDPRRVFREWDRRDGFDRRVRISAGCRRRRVLTQRRFGPRRRWERASDIVGAARRAGHADAQFSHFKVGAAVKTATAPS